MVYSLQKDSFLSVAFIFICTIFIISCNKKSTPTFIDTSSPNNAIKILALGESYTIGQSVVTEERFIDKTIALLNAKGLNIKSPPQIFEQTGWTTQDLFNEMAMKSNSFKPPYDMVTLLIGVNDQYRQFDTAAYRINFTACINRALEYTCNRRNRVFVLSIPDYGATAFGSSNAVQIGKEIDL